MKTVVDKRLFWFLKEGAELDLSKKSQLDMYVQQTLLRGKTSDINTGLLGDWEVGVEGVWNGEESDQ